MPDQDQDPRPALARIAGSQGETTTGHPTGMRLYLGDDGWEVKADMLPELAGEPPMRSDTATLRRVGWLDQKGRVWTRTPAAADFDGGSLTPLLIDVRDR